MAQPTHSAPPATGKLLASVGVRMRLVAASIAILSVGSALAPRQAVTPSRTEERANPLIEEQVAVAAPAAVPFSGVQDAARAPRAHVIEIQPARPTGLDGVASDVAEQVAVRLEGAGVMVSDVFMLTHATALAGRLAVRVDTADGRGGDAVLAAHDPATGLVLLRTTPGLAPPAVLASAAPAAGAMTVTVGHLGRRPLAVPAFVAVADEARVVVALDQSGTAPGLPVFTMDGSLVGVLGPRGSGDVVLATRIVDGLIARAAAGEVPRSFGLAVQRLDGALARAFGTRGVLVSEVVPDGPGSVAGLDAGDVLVAVGDTAVTTLDGAREALATAATAPAATLRILQRGAERAVEIAAVSSYAVAHLARVDPSRATAPTAGAVLPPAVLTALGLAGDAQVLSINGAAVTTRAQAERLLAGRRQTDVLQVRDPRGTWFVALEAAR